MTADRETLVAIENLSVSLPASADRKLAVDSVSLDVRKNEILCIVGESGSGKSLTARAIIGLLPGPMVRAISGRIVFGKEDLLGASDERLRAIRGAEIGTIFQEPMTALNPLKTIGWQIDEVLKLHTKLRQRKRRDRIVSLMKDVHLSDPERLLRSYPHQLSGGQRQRAMIAMALILEPNLLIADEPTTALDVTTQAQILRLIRSLQTERGTGVIFITHDFGVVAEVADRVAVMQEGRVVESGTAREVLSNPQHPYTRALIEAIPRLIPRTRPARTESPVLLQVSRLRKTFRSGGGLFGSSRRTVLALRELNLQLRGGDTLGLVGESGSGKSTAARCLLRLIDADSGSIAFEGVDLQELSASKMRPYRRRMQMVFQDPYGSLNPRHKVGRIISEGPIIHGLPPKEAEARAAKLLQLVGLTPRAAERYPHEFSGGQRQRIAIARALALEPKVIIADEAVSALDVSIQAQILQLFRDIHARSELSLVFITHDLRVAAEICDFIAVMRNGEIVEQGLTSEVFAEPQHPYTRELLESIPGRAWIPSRGIALELAASTG